MAAISSRRSLPVVVEHRGRYARWLPAPDALLALRQSFAFDAASPVYPATIVERPAGRTVLALTSPLGKWTKRYRAAFEAELRRYGVRGVRVVMRACARPAGVSRALDGARARPPLGVVVAVGRSAGGTISVARTRSLLGAALTGVRDAALPTVVSEVPDATAVNDAIAAQTTAAGLPLSPVAAALAVPVTRQSDAGGHRLRRPPPPAVRRPPPRQSDARRHRRLRRPGPVSRSTSTVSTTADLTPALVSAWARLDAATFVRAVQPAFFAPRLAATRLGVSFYERTLTRVGVVDSDAAGRARLIARLDVFGYRALRAPAGSLSAGAQPIVYYRAGDRRLALAVAGDLGLPTTQVLPTVGGAEGVTVVASL